MLAASCYIIYIISEPLKRVGLRLGKLLHLNEDVIASTFQALATSGPEIVMAVLAATPFIANSAWAGLEHAEKAGSGTLNIIFSAMSNLLGIGAVAVIFMIRKGMVGKNEVIKVNASVKSSLLFYVIIAGFLAFATSDSRLNVFESWVMMGIAVLYVITQFLMPVVNRIRKKPYVQEDELEDDEHYEPPLKVLPWMKDFMFNSFLYAILVYGLIVLVRESMGATFDMAMYSVFSISGILIMFTSYISSFPELMLAIRYTLANNKSSLLGMLFGSNVIDLGFGGFRAIWLNETMEIVSTGTAGFLLPYYIWVIPILALAAYAGLITGRMRYRIVYPMLFFYILYIVSGLILL